MGSVQPQTWVLQFRNDVLLQRLGTVWITPAWVCFQLQSSQVRAATAGLPLVPSLRRFHLSCRSLSLLMSSVCSCTGALCSCRYFYCFPEARGPLENCLENCFLKNRKGTNPLLILKKWGGSQQKEVQDSHLLLGYLSSNPCSASNFPRSRESPHQVNGWWVPMTADDLPDNDFTPSFALFQL